MPSFKYLTGLLVILRAKWTCTIAGVDIVTWCVVKHDTNDISRPRLLFLICNEISDSGLERSMTLASHYTIYRKNGRNGSIRNFMVKQARGNALLMSSLHFYQNQSIHKQLNFQAKPRSSSKKGTKIFYLHSFVFYSTTTETNSERRLS